MAAPTRVTAKPNRQSQRRNKGGRGSLGRLEGEEDKPIPPVTRAEVKLPPKRDTMGPQRRETKISGQHWDMLKAADKIPRLLCQEIVTGGGTEGSEKAEERSRGGLQAGRKGWDRMIELAKKKTRKRARKIPRGIPSSIRNGTRS